MSMLPAKLLRLTDVADQLNVSLPTVRRLVKDGRLKTVRVGRVIRVRPQDLEDYIEAATQEPEKEDAGHATNTTGERETRP